MSFKATWPKPSIDNLINVPAIQDQLCFDDVIKIILAEEKRDENDITGRSLIDALPQIIGECIAL